MIENTKKVFNVILKLSFKERCALGERIANSMLRLEGILAGMDAVTIMKTIIASMYIDGTFSDIELDYISNILHLSKEECKYIVNHSDNYIARTNPEFVFNEITSRSKNTSCGEDGVGLFFLITSMLACSCDDKVNEKELSCINKYFSKFFTDNEVDETISYIKRTLNI